MLNRSLRLALLPAIFASIAGCAASPVVPAEVAITPAAIIFGSCPKKPVYPAAAKQEKRHGTLVLTFHVDADASVLEAKVKRSSGHADLDEAARAGLAKCKFKTATRDGVPVRGWTELTYAWQP